MNNDRFKCRAWLEVPIDTSEGITICGFYVYDVAVLPERNHIFPKSGYVGFPLETLKESLGRYREFENDIMERLDGNGNCEISEYLYAEPKSIEQCTGLKDKNSRLIYEADVLRFAINDPEEDYFYGVVRYSSENWKYEIVAGNETFCLCQVLGQDIEVIGNLNENTELLGETNE